MDFFNINPKKERKARKNEAAPSASMTSPEINGMEMMGSIVRRRRVRYPQQYIQNYVVMSVSHIESSHSNEYY